MTETTTAQATPEVGFKRSEDFTTSYANNIFLEASAWDLKLVFGQLDQGPEGSVVKQHLAVTIPWPQAKLALFWLRLQVEIAEAAVGSKIPIRKDLLPVEPPPLTAEQEKDPATKQSYDLYVKLREEFIASL